MKARIAARHAGPSPCQRGVGLVELMISITIGLLLVVMVTSYYLSSRQSYQTTTVTSELIDSQRYAVQLLRRQLLLAGYSDSWRPRKIDFPALTDIDGGEVPAFDDGEFIRSDSEDEIWLRMTGAALEDQPIVSCSNQEFGPEKGGEDPEVFLVRLYLEDATLKCETRGGGTTDVKPLLDGIDALAFSYVDDKDELHTYHEVSDWSSVRAVQLDLLLGSGMETYDTPIKQSFAWQGETKEFEDRHLRSRISRMIALRNAARRSSEEGK